MIQQAQNVISREVFGANLSNMENKLEDRNGVTPFLQMRGISKSYSGVQVLHHVNLSVNTGEVLALVGENGAGKSTLIKTLAGAIQLR